MTIKASRRKHNTGFAPETYIKAYNLARINIEDELFDDPRFLNLSHKLGREMAAGVWVFANRLAQTYWKKDRSHIPSHLAEKLTHFEDLVSSDLLIKTDEGYYLRGSSKYHEWLLDRIKAAQKAGKRSAETRNQVLTSNQTQPNATKSNPLPLPLSPSLTTNTKERTKGEQSSIVAPFIGSFVKAYQNRYGPKTRPELGPKVQGQIKNFLKGRSLEEASALIQVYLQMKDPWFITKCHDFTTFLENIQKVKLSFETGKEAGKKGSRPISEILAEKNGVSRVE